jgi:beta-N-acetylglucosaminidase
MIGTLNQKLLKLSKRTDRMDMPKMQKQYKQLLSEYVVITKQDVRKLVANRNRVLASLQRLENAPSSSNEEKRIRCYQVLNNLESLFEQKQIELVQWLDMTEKMGISIIEIKEIENLVIDNRIVRK